MKPSPLVLAVLLGLTGCGGGGGGGRKGSSGARGTAAGFAITWGARTRAIEGPGSALSAAVTLAGASATGGNLITTVNRSASLAGYTGDYATREGVKPGAYVLIVRFFAGADGTGNVVAQGTANVTIAGDGSGIGSVAVGNAVASVKVVEGQVLPIDAVVLLLFEARSANGGLLALSPGSAAWSSPSNAGVLALTEGGVATALQAGTASVQVTVDGVTSAAAPVTVLPIPLASVVIDPGQSVPVGATKALSFTAKDARGNVVSLAPESIRWSLYDGETSLRVTPEGLATALQAGTARVRVEAGGLTSAPETITVPSTHPGGDIPAHPPYFVYLTASVDYGNPTDLSGDGLIAIGYLQDGDGSKPLVWKDPSTVGESLPGFAPSDSAFIGPLSTDGKVALGVASPTFQGGIPTLFRLDGGRTALPLPAGNARGSVADLNADGTVALCTDEPQTAPFNPRPYVVRDGVATYLPLPIGTTRVRVGAISGDGSTVVGTIDDRAARWVDGGAPEFIAEAGSGVSGVNYDGRVVVGTQRGVAGVRSVPFRWTPENGAQPIPPSPDYAVDAGAIGVSADGRTVLISGDSNSGIDSVAQLWREGQGTRTVAELFAEAGGDPATFDGGNARTLSADGRTILGSGRRMGPGALRAGTWKLMLP